MAHRGTNYRYAQTLAQRKSRRECSSDVKELPPLRQAMAPSVPQQWQGVNGTKTSAAFSAPIPSAKEITETKQQLEETAKIGETELGKVETVSSTQDTIIMHPQSSKQDLLFRCPECKLTWGIDMNAINCGIFRCGVYKDSGLPLPQHATEDVCKKLKAEGKIIGCGSAIQYRPTHAAPTLCSHSLGQASS